MRYMPETWWELASVPRGMPSWRALSKTLSEPTMFALNPFVVLGQVGAEMDNEIAILERRFDAFRDPCPDPPAPSPGPAWRPQRSLYRSTGRDFPWPRDACMSARRDIPAARHCDAFERHVFDHLGSSVFSDCICSGNVASPAGTWSRQASRTHFAGRQLLFLLAHAVADALEKLCHLGFEMQPLR